jgi:hypothetical protein
MTGFPATEEVVAARPELVWEMVADVTRIGGWSPGVVTEADRPRAFAWVVLDDGGNPAHPSASWRYLIDPLPGGGSRVRQRFTHGPGDSFLRAVAAAESPRAAGAR